MKKTVLTSLVLVTVGILFGAILVSNFSGGVDLSFARSGGEVKLGGPTPVTVQSPGLKAISDNFVAVAKAVTPSVVAITVTTSGKKADKNMPHDFFHFFGPDFKQQEPQPEQGMGSGVIITADGYIVTNNHVVDDADKDGIEVVMNDKLRYKAKLIGTDPSTDLAVVKIDAKDLPAAALGNSDNVQVGEWALAIGNRSDSPPRSPRGSSAPKGGASISYGTTTTASRISFRRMRRSTRGTAGGARQPERRADRDQHRDCDHERTLPGVRLRGPCKYP